MNNKPGRTPRLLSSRTHIHTRQSRSCSDTRALTSHIECPNNFRIDEYTKKLNSLCEEGHDTLPVPNRGSPWARRRRLDLTRHSKECLQAQRQNRAQRQKILAQRCATTQRKFLQKTPDSSTIPTNFTNDPPRAATKLSYTWGVGGGEPTTTTGHRMALRSIVGRGQEFGYMYKNSRSIRVDK